jgi:DNA-binding NarL/FixJ family response regulator
LYQGFDRERTAALTMVGSPSGNTTAGKTATAAGSLEAKTSQASRINAAGTGWGRYFDSAPARSGMKGIAVHDGNRMAVQPAVPRVNGAHADIDRRENPASRTTASRTRSAAIPSARSASETGSAPDADAVPALTPVKLSIIAGDPVTGQGAVAYLRTRQEVDLLTAERQHEAEVVLIVVSQVTEETVSWMQHAAQRTDGDVRFVLVGDGVREHHLHRAVAHGLVSVLSRQESDFERILRAVVAVRDGKLEMPEIALGWLMQQLRSVQHDVLAPKGLTSSGLETREVDVLRLLADGMDTEEVAVRLNYSERTVKNIIHGMLTRLRLKNRAQAVAYALRNGAL